MNKTIKIKLDIGNGPIWKEYGDDDGNLFTNIDIIDNNTEIQNMDSEIQNLYFELINKEIDNEKSETLSILNNLKLTIKNKINDLILKIKELDPEFEIINEIADL